MNFTSEINFRRKLSMLTMLAITVIGAVLGLRFKAFVLVPAIAISSVVSSSVSIVHGNSLWSTSLATFFIVTVLQVGYFAGTVIRFGIARARARKHPSGIVAVAQRR
jgi:hypothetical protein